MIVIRKIFNPPNMQPQSAGHGLAESSRPLSKPNVMGLCYTWLVRVGHHMQSFPAALAVLVQCLALVAVLACTWAIYLTATVFSGHYLTFPIAGLVLLQALFSATGAYYFGMDKWWRWIHFCFPIAVWCMSIFAIPNVFYLIGFLVSLSMFWTTFRTQVPYYPSRQNIWEKVSIMAHQFKAQTHHNQPIRMIDIGSGLGGMSLHLAKLHPDADVAGIEIAPLPWLISRVRTLLQGSKAKFILGNYYALNFADYDIVFAYLSPAAMQALWVKARSEMRSGTLLMSLEFEIPGVTPLQCIAGNGESPDLFVWQLP